MKKKIRTAVFPAAGLGTRFLPATKSQPKEMLPLVDKPLIQYVVEEAVNSGIENIIVVTGRGKNSIEDHFDISYELENLLQQRGQHELLKTVHDISDMIHISYVRQKEALGLGHAVLMARELVGSQPFAVLLGDDIIDAPVPCLRQMIDLYNEDPATYLAIQVVPKQEVSNYGVISGVSKSSGGSTPRLYDVRDLVEKPSKETAPSNLAVIGRYILEPEIFDALDATCPGKGGEIQLTDALRGLLEENHSIYGHVFEGKRYDAGSKLGFLMATVEFALKRPDLGAPFREYLKTLLLNDSPPDTVDPRKAVTSALA
jgi:UTP--glucose-1-phosphate uridylyltransferase